MKTLLLLFPLLFLSGCYSVILKHEHNSAGAYGSDAKYESSVPKWEDVKVYVNNCPKGFTLTNNVIEVVDGYNHELLGNVSVKFEKIKLEPIVWITLLPSLGASAPLTYNKASKEAYEKDLLIKELKKAAYKRGADAVVFASFTSDNVPMLVLTPGMPLVKGVAVKLN